MNPKQVPREKLIKSEDNRYFKDYFYVEPCSQTTGFQLQVLSQLMTDATLKAFMNVINFMQVNSHA